MTLNELDREGIKMNPDNIKRFGDIPVLAADMSYQEYGTGYVVEDGEPKWFIDDYEVEG